MSQTGRRRYICTIVIKDEEKGHKPKVTVVAAFNNMEAKETLKRKYNILDIEPDYSYKDDLYLSTGIVSVRLAETNTYEDGDDIDRFFRDTEPSI